MTGEAINIRSRDTAFMQTALGLAARGLGRVWPNPAVGCIIVSPDGRVISRGWTQPGGRPHAEAFALAQAGAASRGATAYVTLEPCAHTGKTPPCANALVNAGVARVVVATTDPDARVNGRGIEILRNAGIQVDVGLMSAEARALNQGFFLSRTAQRPAVTLKIASTLDGKIAMQCGESKWITGPAARAHGHMLRATHDAIAVGIGTVLADDPVLDCRLSGLVDRSPIRIVFDTQGRLPLESRMFTDDGAPVWQITGAGASSDVPGIRQVFQVGTNTVSQVNIIDALRVLASEGITRLLVEGGPRLATAFLRAEVVDDIYWYRSPSVIGGSGMDALGDPNINRLQDRPFFDLLSTHQLGRDRVEHYGAQNF